MMANNKKFKLATTINKTTITNQPNHHCRTSKLKAAIRLRIRPMLPSSLLAESKSINSKLKSLLMMNKK